jgi:high-affinity Fe2+/Pb2+ permease
MIDIITSITKWLSDFLNALFFWKNWDEFTMLMAIFFIIILIFGIVFLRRNYKPVKIRLRP